MDQKSSEPKEKWLCHGCGTIYFGPKLPKFCSLCQEEIGEDIKLVKLKEERGKGKENE